MSHDKAPAAHTTQPVPAADPCPHPLPFEPGDERPDDTSPEDVSYFRDTRGAKG